MYADRVSGLKSSAIRDILKLTAKPGMISFAGGLPAPELFPLTDIAASAGRVLAKFGSQPLQYAVTEGLLALREKIGSGLEPTGTFGPDNVVITSGSQQSLDLIAKLFIDKDAPVFTENPTYLGALQSFRLFQADIIAVPSDRHGILIDALKGELAKRKPKFLYVMPNFQNPTGIAYPLERRKALVALAREHDLLLIEDDPYGELIFEGERMPSLFTLAGGRNVLYLSSYSKTIAPGLRVAYVAGDREVLKKLVIAKQGTDLQTNTYGQYIVNDYLENGNHRAHLDAIRRTYRSRRDIMLAAMEQRFPKSVSWNRPSGGMFLWVMLPGGSDAKEILLRCIELNVAYVPGQEFFPDHSGGNTLRMNFSNASPENIEEGIRRMGRVLASGT